jgi:hypothetical protein
MGAQVESIKGSDPSNEPTHGYGTIGGEVCGVSHCHLAFVQIEFTVMATRCQAEARHLTAAYLWQHRVLRQTAEN